MLSSARLRYEEAVARPAGRVRDGCLRYREDIPDEIENCRGAIGELYRGETWVKRLFAFATTEFC